MFVTLLAILFSDLTFSDLTIQGLMDWYNLHPFAFIIAIQDVILGALILFRLFNEYVAFEEHYEEDCCSNDPSTWVVYTNDSKDKNDNKTH